MEPVVVRIYAGTDSDGKNGMRSWLFPLQNVLCIKFIKPVNKIQLALVEWTLSVYKKFLRNYHGINFLDLIADCGKPSRKCLIGMSSKRRSSTAENKRAMVSCTWGFCCAQIVQESESPSWSSSRMFHTELLDWRFWNGAFVASPSLLCIHRGNRPSSLQDPESYK